MINKNCNRCGESFETKVEKRKYCHKCSPFLQALSIENKIDQFKRENGIIYRRCNACLGYLENTKEFFPENSAGNCLGKCRKCFQLKNKERDRAKKEKCVQYKGGKCIKCGYSKCPASFDFHHRDPNQKDFNIAHTRKTFENIKAELDKCDLLCRNCHSELHYELNTE